MLKKKTAFLATGIVETSVQDQLQCIMRVPFSEELYRDNLEFLDKNCGLVIQCLATDCTQNTLEWAFAFFKRHTMRAEDIPRVSRAFKTQEFSRHVKQVLDSLPILDIGFHPGLWRIISLVSPKTFDDAVSKLVTDCLRSPDSFHFQRVGAVLDVLTERMSLVERQRMVLPLTHKFLVNLLKVSMDSRGNLSKSGFRAVANTLRCVPHLLVPFLESRVFQCWLKELSLERMVAEPNAVLVLAAMLSFNLKKEVLPLLTQVFGVIVKTFETPELSGVGCSILGQIRYQESDFEAIEDWFKSISESRPGLFGGLLRHCIEFDQPFSADWVYVFSKLVVLVPEHCDFTLPAFNLLTSKLVCEFYKAVDDNSTATLKNCGIVLGSIAFRTKIFSRFTELQCNQVMAGLDAFFLNEPSSRTSLSMCILCSAYEVPHCRAHPIFQDQNHPFWPIFFNSTSGEDGTAYAATRFKLLEAIRSSSLLALLVTKFSTQFRDFSYLVIRDADIYPSIRASALSLYLNSSVVTEAERNKLSKIQVALQAYV